MKKIERLLTEFKDGEISFIDAHRKIDVWIKTSYATGIKTGMIKPKEWQTLCEPCGRYMFPHADKKKMDGITLIKGKCPRCTHEAYLVPIRDWMYASDLPGLMWD